MRPRALCLAAALALLPLPGLAQGCRLALALALDVSSSVDAAEDALQRGGLAAALTAPEVVRAAFSSPRPVALAAYEWSGRGHQSIVLNWTLLHGPEDLAQAARVIADSRRAYDTFETAMGHALAFGAALLTRAPDCDFQTIDLSGDGRNNDGFGPRIAYTDPAFARITVNGLVINAADFEGELDLIDIFRREVLHGPGAFLEIAQGFDDFERAMRRKLERELRGQVIGVLPARQGPPG
ncbi:DUF1194 domain-containing protein [Marimonas lutisalis]|uniref:DUF1194 domain-containing protein n=1 Tax=Marimonas lutisalis TaxID=2545756 RepID=UPI001F1813A3|nr:DUF1194 domain-containing protein [Marimonas lutisalis]